MKKSKSKSRNAAPLNVTPVDTLSVDTLQDMRDAGREIGECYRVLSKASMNVVGECLKNQGTFFELNHYPAGDVYDNETHAQYYYHTHRGIRGEHGHFHTFMRARGIADGVTPVPYDGDTEWPRGNDAVSHLIAISMDKRGYPIGLFATNRWVTGETWYAARDVVHMVDNYVIDHAYPNWPVNRWITAMFRLFKPQILALIEQRDVVVKKWLADHPTEDVYEDRKLEMTGEIPISVDRQLSLIEHALSKH
ncbi:MAG: hypothetical protein OEQ39_05585 [Gammaproteobacteria bacterium]|nr:hypothetical protein [Gammaproteobacteria bacterium]MDH3467181.1 hypothetical protein [Gammaproteobacteria bacterium]